MTITMPLLDDSEPTPPIDDDRWAAVLDHRTDAGFFYAVITTGVYCRPSCTSRRPRRENVRFFDTPAAARAAGFRACQRCAPEADRDDKAATVEQACRLIDASDERIPTLTELAAVTGSTPDRLRRAFVHTLGITPHQYGDARRVERLRAQLRAAPDVTGAVFAAGYGSTSRIYEHADSRLGMTPGEYRRDGGSRTVRFSTAPCRLGRVLVATTDRGICRVMLGDDDDALEQALRAELPAAGITRDDDTLAASLVEVTHRLSGNAPTGNLPLDIRGTAFQQRVWQALQRIPIGETRTYGEIAGEIGSPRAARAVGQACGANEVAVVIPCHRAVRASGDPGKYRWGSERKRRLLETEANPADDDPNRGPG